MKRFTSIPLWCRLKSLLLISILTIVALPGFSSGSDPLLKKGNNPYYNGECPSITVGGKSYKLRNVYGSPVATKASADDVIYEAKGTEKLYSKESYGTAMLGKEMILYNDVFPASVVWGDNNEVYFKDILSTVATDTYVKGVISDNVITIQAGQIVDYIEDEEYGDYAVAIGLGRTEINEEEDTFDFYYDPSITEYSIKVNKNGNMELVLPGEPFNGQDPTEYILCLYYTDELLFAGYSDFAQKYTEVDYELVTMPFGVDTEQYVYIDDFDYASFIQVAYTDQYIYIQGLDPMLPEGVVRAKIDGNKATIVQNEYVGIYMGMFYIFTKVWYNNPEYSEFKPWLSPYILAPEDEVFVLTFDREAGIIKSENKGVYLSFQPDEDSFSNANCFLEDFVLKYQATSAGTPANPTIGRYFTDLIPALGYGDFQFTISNYSTEGYVLDVNHLFYQVLVNGEPIVFGEGPLININGDEVIAYENVPADQRWLPYLFSNDDDIFKWSSSEFDIGIYKADVKTLGVQSLYRYEGVYTYSQVVTLDVETGDITESEGAGVQWVTDASVVAEEYFTLSGIKVNDPKNGIFVKRTIYSDGKTVVTKQLIP